MPQQVVVITGTSSGIGLEVAVQGAEAAEAGPYSSALQGCLKRTADAFSASSARSAAAAAAAAAPIVELLDAEQPAFRIQASPTAVGFVTPKPADLDGSSVIGMTSGWIA